MSEVKHTPGPWRTRKSESEAPDDFVVMADKTGESICDCTAGNPYMSEEEALANARLIATAPEMLLALKEIIEELPLGADEPFNARFWKINAASAAIAKAEGKTQ